MYEISLIYEVYKVVKNEDIDISDLVVEQSLSRVRARCLQIRGGFVGELL